MPQAIKLIDAEGRSCIYVPITQNGKVVDSTGVRPRGQMIPDIPRGNSTAGESAGAPCPILHAIKCSSVAGSSAQRRHAFAYRVRAHHEAALRLIRTTFCNPVPSQAGQIASVKTSRFFS